MDEVSSKMELKSYKTIHEFFQGRSSASISPKCPAEGRIFPHNNKKHNKWLKLLFRKDSGEILGAHIYGLHAADLIQEVANALARKQSVVDLATEVHTHPTLSEVVEVAYKQAVQQMKNSS